jgi:hypothetical protein
MRGEEVRVWRRKKRRRLTNGSESTAKEEQKKKKKKEITREAKLGGELPTEQKSFFLSISSIISPRQKTR